MWNYPSEITLWLRLIKFEFDKNKVGHKENINIGEEVECGYHESK